MKDIVWSQNNTVCEWTGPTGVRFREVATPAGTFFHDTTPQPVINVLETARANGSRVRLFFGNLETGQDWLEENDVCGTIGRSMGPLKVPLLIANHRSMGGGAILTDSIVRILVHGRETYRHPKYQPPTFTITPIGETETCGGTLLKQDGYTHGVDANGERHANFKSLAKAVRWVKFMRGERMTK